MNSIASRPVAHLLFAAAGVAVMVAAFLRGNYLLGLVCGIVYAGVAFALLLLLARSRTPGGGVSVARVAFVAVLAVPVGYVMAFPSYPDVQIFIDKQATERKARGELAAVFASDPAYRDLSVTSVQLKVVNISVRGVLGTRADLDRLRSRIAAECPALGECLLHWEVALRDSGQRLSGLDRDLCQDAWFPEKRKGRIVVRLESPEIER